MAPSPAVRVLVIDENHRVALLLERGGLRVSVASFGGALVMPDGADGFDAVALGPHGAVEDRVQCCRQLRLGGYAGVVVATCADAAEGALFIEAGADDFAVAIAELTTRMVSRTEAGAKRSTADVRLIWGPIELDRVSRTLRLRGRTVVLTVRECDLLACLIESKGRVVSRASLRERVWKGVENRGTNLVEVHLSRLREKLGDDAQVIQTVRREGYRLRT